MEVAARIVNDRLIVMAQDRRKKEHDARCRRPSMLYFHKHETRAENMTCNSEAGVNSRRHSNRLTRVRNGSTNSKDAYASFSV